MNFVKKFLVKRIKGRIKVSRGVKALLLLVSNFFAGPWEPASLFCSLMKLTKRLSHEFHQVQDSKAIVIKI